MSSDALPAAVAETHISVVTFIGDRAYKLKKPVDLGFLDFSTREKRERACRAEVDLNRRLAPDVYLGVADVHGPDGEVCDHLVVMRRMPVERRLSTLVLAEAEEVADDVDVLAARIADFHRTAERGPAIDDAASPEAVLANWDEDFHQLVPFVGEVLDEATCARVEERVHAYLAGRGDLLRQRIDDGRICDGHGDLQAADIFLIESGPQVLDCIEFSERYRHGDVAADIAFLAMDLERLGSAAMADRFLARYLELADDPCPRSLLDHYIAYRAHVRCKVACMRAAQLDSEARDEAVAEARTLLALCDRHLERAQVRLVVVGGAPGTGKSTLAAHIGDRLGATVLRSDVVRKELAGLAATDHAEAPLGEGLYAAAATDDVYRSLLDRARPLLAGGVNVVLDASWTDASKRAAARTMAAEAHAACCELRCTLAPDVARERILDRMAAETDASDATPEVAAALAAAADPWPEATDVDTSPTRDDVTAAALAALAITQTT